MVSCKTSKRIYKTYLITFQSCLTICFNFISLPLKHLKFYPKLETEPVVSSCFFPSWFIPLTELILEMCPAPEIRS